LKSKNKNFIWTNSKETPKLDSKYEGSELHQRLLENKLENKELFLERGDYGVFFIVKILINLERDQAIKIDLSINSWKK